MDGSRIVKGSPEQRTQNQRLCIRKHRRILFRMKTDAVRLIGNGSAGSVRMHKKGRHGGRSGPDDSFRADPALFQCMDHDFGGRILSEAAKNRCFHSEFCGGNGFIDGLSADIQRAGNSSVSGCRHGLWIKPPDNRIHQGNANADQIIHMGYASSRSGSAPVPHELRTGPCAPDTYRARNFALMSLISRFPSM